MDTLHLLLYQSSSPLQAHSRQARAEHISVTASQLLYNYARTYGVPGHDAGTTGAVNKYTYGRRTQALEEQRQIKAT
jgi:hypothetical protein